MDPINEIKERIPIEELVSEYLELKPAGIHMKALCPFHAEKTPSFIVSPHRGTFHCFGCGKHGDIFTFLQEMEGLDFKEALQKLADRAGVKLDAKRIKFKSNKNLDILYEIMQKAQEFYELQLSKNADAKEYLQSRGFNDELIKTFKLGYAPDSWDMLLNYLTSISYKIEDIEKVGLIKKSSNEKYYDRFRSRIMFPIFDEAGKTVAFSGRIFQKDDEAKYINSPETILYQKSKVLYGFNFAKQYSRKLKSWIIVEGQADLLAMHASGFKNAIALSGTALTDEHIKKMMRFGKNVIFALDADDAGISSIIKNSQKLLSLDFSIKVLDIPESKDPADIFKGGGKQAIKELVFTSKDLFEFLINYFKKSLSNEEKYVKILRSRVLPLLLYISSSVEREKRAQLLADAMSVSKESILEDLLKSGTNSLGKSMSAKAPLAMSDEKIKEARFRFIIFSRWIDGHKSLNLEFKEKLKKSIKDLSEQLSINLNEDIDTKILEAEFIKLDLEYFESKNSDVQLFEYFKVISKILLQSKLEEISKKIRKAELENNEELVESLMEDHLKLQQQINAMEYGNKN